MTLWVFSNEAYGFGREIALAAALSALTSGARTILVLSRRDISQRRARRFQIRLWRRVLSEVPLAARLKSVALWPRISVVGDVNEERFLQRVQQGDAGLIAGFHQIFSAHAIERFSPFLNVHPSVLPLYRGPVPSRWCLALGETRTGFTVHHVAERIDSGKIVYQESIDIPPGADETRLDQLLSVQAAAAIPELVSALLQGYPVPQRQVNAREVYRHHVGYAGFGDPRPPVNPTKSEP